MDNPPPELYRVEAHLNGEVVYYEEAEGKTAVDAMADKWLKDNPELDLMIWLLVGKRGIIKEGVA